MKSYDSPQIPRDRTGHTDQEILYGELIDNVGVSESALSPTHPDVLALLPIGTPTLEQMLALNRMADGGGDIARAAAYVLALIDADQVQQAWRMIDIAESLEAGA